MNNNVLATVGNLEITKEQMIQLIRSLPQQQAMDVSSVEGRKRLLQEMIAGELLYLDAKAKGYDNEAEYIKMVEVAAHGLLQRYAMQKALSDINVTTEEAKNYYESDKNELLGKNEVEARHILVTSEEEADKVYEEIQAGLDFSEAAKKYSTCPSKESGGALGAFSRGMMVPEFEEAAFTLALNTVSQPVKTQFGYHLIIVDKKSNAAQKSFEEVEAQIKQRLLMAMQEKAYFDKVDALKDLYPVEMNEEALI